MILLYFLEASADLTVSEGGGRGSPAPCRMHVPWLQVMLPWSRCTASVGASPVTALTAPRACPHRHLLLLVPGDPGGLHRWLHLGTRPPGSAVGLQACPVLPQTGWSSHSFGDSLGAPFPRLEGGPISPRLLASVHDLIPIPQNTPRLRPSSGAASSVIMFTVQKRYFLTQY